MQHQKSEISEGKGKHKPRTNLLNDSTTSLLGCFSLKVEMNSIHHSSLSHRREPLGFRVLKSVVCLNSVLQFKFKLVSLFGSVSKIDL